MAPGPTADLDGARAVLEDFGRFWESEADPVKRRELVGQLFERVWIDESRIVAVRPTKAFAPFFERRPDGRGHRPTNDDAAPGRGGEVENTGATGIKPGFYTSTESRSASDNPWPRHTARATILRICVNRQHSSSMRARRFGSRSTAKTSITTRSSSIAQRPRHAIVANCLRSSTRTSRTQRRARRARPIGYGRPIANAPTDGRALRRHIGARTSPPHRARRSGDSSDPQSLRPLVVERASRGRATTASDASGTRHRRRSTTRRDRVASAGSPDPGASLTATTLRGPIARRDPPRRRSRTTQRRRDRSRHDLRRPTAARLRAPPTRCGSADGRSNAVGRPRSRAPRAWAISTNDNAAPERSGEVESTGATGLEPATSGVTGRRSNQLSYAPE